MDSPRVFPSEGAVGVRRSKCCSVGGRWRCAGSVRGGNPEVRRHARAQRTRKAGSSRRSRASARLKTARHVQLPRSCDRRRVSRKLPLRGRVLHLRGQHAPFALLQRNRPKLDAARRPRPARSVEPESARRAPRTARQGRGLRVTPVSRRAKRTVAAMSSASSRGASSVRRAASFDRVAVGAGDFHRGAFLEVTWRFRPQAMPASSN